MVGYGATDGVVPFLVKHVLDGVFAAQNKGLLYALPAIIIVFAIVRALLDFWQQFLMSKVGHLIVKDIRTRLHDHLLKLSPDFFVANSSAKLVSSVTSDVVLVRTLLTEALASVIRDVIRVVALVSAALYLDVTLALIALIAFPIGVIPVYRFGRRMRRLSRVGQEAIGNLSSILQETALGNRVVKIFGKERYEAERFAGENERLTSTFLRAEKVRALGGPVNEVLASIAISGVLLYGGFSVIGGIRSQGDFIAFLLAVFLMYDPFKKLSRVNSVVQQGLAGSERIFRVLDSVPSVREPEAPLPLPKEYDITFENVSYSYKGVAGDLSEHIALTGINLEIKAGQKVALVGFSGAGKSTLVDLIPRFMDPQQGLVRLGG
ncbi:MAG: ABC transporter permease, partial [Proteobacteria bacterium]